MLLSHFKCVTAYNLGNRLADLENAIDRCPLKVTPDTLLIDAIALMSNPSNDKSKPVSRKASSVLVIDGERLVGVLTERDVVRLTAQGIDFARVTMGEVMTRQLVTLTLTDSQDISAALQAMREHRIRHLPIVDALGQLIGIVSSESIRYVLEPSNLLKLRRVEEAMVTQTIHAPPTATVLSLCQLMNEHRVSCVVIVEKREEEILLPIGIVTERDIVQFQTRGLDLAQNQAESVMSTPLLCISPTDSLWQVRQDMERLRMRRLVVTDEQGQLLGIVTQTSLLQTLDLPEIYSAMTLLQKTLDEQTTQLKQVNRQLQGEISERQLLEKNLLEKEAQLRAVLSALTDLILVVKVWEGAIGEIKVMPTNHNGFNGASANIIDQTIEQLSQEFGGENFHRPIRQALYKQQTVSFEYGLSIGKTQFWFIASISPISEDSVIWVARDITNRKQTEENLRKSEECLRTLVNNIPGAAYRYACQDGGKIEFISESIQKITGYQASDYINYGGRSLESITFFQDRQRTEKFILKALSHQEPYNLEYRIVDANGNIRWVSEKGQGIFSITGELLYRDGVIFEISDRKQAEKELDYRLTFEQLISTLSTYFINLSLDRIEQGINYALQGVSKFFGFDRSYVFLASDPVKKVITKTYEWCAPGIAPQIHQLQNLVFEAGEFSPWWIEQIRQFKVVQIPDVAQLSPEAKAKLIEPNVSSLIILLVVSQGSLIGAVKFHCLQKKKIRVKDSITLLKLFTQMLANVIERKQAEEARKRIEKELFQGKELAQVTLQSIGDAVITTDAQGRIEYFNPIAEQLTGWKCHEAKGMSLSEVFKIVNEDTRKPVDNPVDKVLREGRIISLANGTVLISRDGTEYAIDDSAAPIRDRNGQLIGAVLVFHDVTQSRHLSRQLSWQASHDTLTGLVNRGKFEQELLEAIASATHDQQQHALCYIDLDRFKVVNDSCGHVAGDELLRQVTHLLQKRVRTTDILARLGGDEFGLLLYQCPLPKAQQIGETIRQIIQEFRFTWDGKTFAIGASIGLVVIDADSQDLNSLLGAADAACYTAKGNGRNCVRVYRPDDRELAKQRSERRWIAVINQALEENRFRLYYQKIVPLDCNSDEAYYEILLRLVDEQGKLVSPMAFIPAAERYDLMPAIDRWVIHTFLTGYEHYLREHGDRPDGLYTINLSGASVNNPQFCNFLVEQLRQSQIPPQKICFEITETTALSNLEQAANLIHSLKKLGCRFALDDFGSGMSSLVYLKNLPVDYLKIDGSFVKNIASDPIDRVMVESLNQISHIMGIQTIAEYVENRATLNLLKEIGVDYAQGYGIAKPCPCPFN